MTDLQTEAQRCLQCKIPNCVEHCPIHNKIPEFIAQIKKKDYQSAYEIITSVNPLGAICGRVCYQEKQCQSGCVRGIKGEPIAIGELEYRICDWALEKKLKAEKNTSLRNGIQVAVIGGGPAGIACAVELDKAGFSVTIFEKESFLGGILMYGIPEYRLSKKLVREVIMQAIPSTIKVEYNKSLGKEISIPSLFKEGFSDVFVAIGAEKSIGLKIPGSLAKGVLGANDFLRQEEVGNEVIVIGGGNVAMDVARVAKRRGAQKVTVVYRKQRQDMPANLEEVQGAQDDGVEFVFQTNVLRIETEKQGEQEMVKQVVCDTHMVLNADMVIFAIGSVPNQECFECIKKDTVNECLKNQEWIFTEQGLLKVNEKFETNLPHVYAGGDLVQKKATVCMAIQNGKEVARNIIKRHNLSHKNFT